MRNRILCTFALLILSISTGYAPTLLRAGYAAVRSPVKTSVFLLYDVRNDMVGNFELSVWDAYKRHIIAGLALFTMQTMLIVGLLVHRAWRRKAERALKENRQILQSTIDALDGHIALLDETGKIIAVNRPWTRFAHANGYAGSDGGRR
jgi:PAS domain-containing protein